MPIAVAVTTDGKDSIFGVSSIRGAEIIGWPTVYFPGRHNVAKDMPEEFANTLDGVIEELRL
jgi:hypothetical protein